MTIRHPKAMYFDQSEFEVRCEWGLIGLARLAPESEVVVIVDVLSFSTCVDLAVKNGALVLPYAGTSPREYARAQDAILAGRARDRTRYSLSPASLLNIPAGTRLVLPSLNGATLSLATGRVPTFAGCLRNARAVAAAAQALGTRIAVIPAGERWPDGSLRFALEDLLGAGAIMQHLPGRQSPEAQAAVAVFARMQEQLPAALRQCSSGKELIGRGFARDVELAAALDAGDCAPILREGAYTRFTGQARAARSRRGDRSRTRAGKR